MLNKSRIWNRLNRRKTENHSRDYCEECMYYVSVLWLPSGYSKHLVNENQRYEVRQTYTPTIKRRCLFCFFQTRAFRNNWHELPSCHHGRLFWELNTTTLAPVWWNMAWRSRPISSLTQQRVTHAKLTSISCRATESCFRLSLTITVINCERRSSEVLSFSRPMTV